MTITEYRLASEIEYLAVNAEQFATRASQLASEELDGGRGKRLAADLADLAATACRIADNADETGSARGPAARLRKVAARLGEIADDVRRRSGAGSRLSSAD
jgi:hypothetical protein